MASKLILVAVAVIVAAAALAAFMYTGGRGNGSGKASSATPGAAAAPGAASGGGGDVGNVASLASCGEGPAVAIVYARGQEKLAAQLARLLEQQLGQDLPGAKYCTVPAEKVGVELRVLPSILVRGRNMSRRLSQILDNATSVEGFHPVKYDVAATFALRIAYAFNLPRPRYNAKAELVVVQGHLPEARLDIDRLRGDRMLMDSLAAAFAANITGVREEAEDRVPAEALALGERPLVVAYSPSYNLSKGTANVVSYGKGYYGLSRGDIGQALLSRGLVQLLEVEGGVVETRGHPSIGSGKVHIAIFEDFACPFCAKFYEKDLPKLLKLAREGRITLHFMDLVVHNAEQVRRLHTLLLCYYQKTGDAEGYVEAASRIYRKLSSLLAKLQAKEINETQLLDELGKLADEMKEELGVDPANCSKALQEVIASTQMAIAAGLRGTPSFVIWYEGSPVAYYTIGYHPADFFEKLADELYSATQAGGKG